MPGETFIDKIRNMQKLFIWSFQKEVLQGMYIFFTSYTMNRQDSPYVYFILFIINLSYFL